MASERLQSRVKILLGEAEDAISESDWEQRHQSEFDAAAQRRRQSLVLAET